MQIGLMLDCLRFILVLLLGRDSGMGAGVRDAECRGVSVRGQCAGAWCGWGEHAGQRGRVRGERGTTPRDENKCFKSGMG